VIQTSTSLKYEPSSELLLITAYSLDSGSTDRMASGGVGGRAHNLCTAGGNSVVESVYESTLHPTQAMMLDAGESRPVHGIAAGYLRG
jgi:hypothetical protein